MDLCYDDTRSIKILLAPVGLNSCFESQFLLVSNFRELDLNDLTRPSSWNAPQNFRYSHMDRGSLIFDYLRPDDIQSRGYDKLKAVIMVIGLLNFPDFVQNNLAYGDAIANFFKDFGSVPVCRLLIFNHNFETAVLSLSNFPTIHQSDPDLIVTMPPNSTTFNLHLQVVMSVACIRVIDALLARIKVLIARPDNTNNSDTISCSGDYFLQLCAPLEALEYYAVSIEEERRRLRDTGKTTLLSNRLEGFAMAGTLVAQLEILQDDRIRKEFQRSLEHIMQRCSLTFQSDKNLDLSPDEMTPSAPILHDEEKRLGQMVISALHEALDLHVQYTRVASEARCALKLAAVVADAYLRGHRSHGEIDIWDMLLRAVGTEGLTASQSVTCLVLGSQLCVRIGLRRKAALLLYMAGLVSADAVGPLASTLFANAGELYGVTGTRVDALAWRKMRCELLAYTSYTTRQADLPMDSIRYVCELVQLMGFTEAWAVESVGPYLDGVTYSNSEEENLKGAYLVPTERHLSSSITPFGLPTAKLSSGRLSTESPSMRRSFAPSVGGDSSNISSFRPIHSPLQSLSRSANRQSKSFSTKSASHRDTSNKSFVKFPTPDLNRQKNSLVAFRVRMESRLKQVARASLEPFKIDRDSNSNVISRASTIVANVNSYGTDYSPPVDALTSLHGLLESSCPTLEMQQQAVQMLQDGANLLSDAGEFVDLPLPLFSCRLVAISLVSQSHRQSAAVISSLRSSILTTLSEDKERSIDQPVPEITKGLFYDPFADKRVRTKDDSLQQGCQLWCVGAICFVSVSLCNPLSTHVSFSCVQPVFEGERVEDVQLFEQSLLIPANSAAFVVQLRVRPQERGNLKLAGLRLCIGKTERIIYVDENGSFKATDKSVQGIKSLQASTKYPKDGMYLFPLDVKVIGEKPMLRAQASATTLELLPGEVRYATLRWYNEGSADCVGDWRLVVTAVVNSITHSLVLIAFTSGLALAIPSKPSLLESFMKTEIIRKPDGTNSDIWLALKIKLSYIPGLRSVSFDLEVISSSDIDHFRQSLLKDRTNPPEPIYAHKFPMSIEVKSSSGRGVVAISTRIEETKRVSRYDEPSPNVKTLFSTACGHNGTEILHECMALQVLVGVLNESSHLCNLLMDGEQLSLPPGSSMPVRVTAESDISAWRWSLPDTKRFGVVIVPNSIKEKIQILLQQVQLRMPCRVILDSIKVEIDGGEMIVSVPTRSPLNMKLTLKRASIANDSAVSAKIRLRLVVTDSYGSNVIESFRSGRWNVELDVAPNDSIEHRVVVGFTQSGIYYLHSAACITTESGEIVWQYKGFIKIHSVAPAVT